MFIESDYIYDLTKNTQSPASNFDNFESELLQSNNTSETKNKSLDIEPLDELNSDKINKSFILKPNERFKFTVIKNNNSFAGSSRHLFKINKIPNSQNITDIQKTQTSNQNDIYIYVDLTKKPKDDIEFFF